ncbi:hypothetical protein SHPE106448_17090 [Shewanella pealeana]
MLKLDIQHSSIAYNKYVYASNHLPIDSLYQEFKPVKKIIT